MRNNRPKSYDYIEKLTYAESSLMQAARKNSEKLGLGAISLSPVEANILKFLVTAVSSEKIVEIGTLTGLSALYLLENLKAGAYLWTLEKSNEHAGLAAEVLQSYIEAGQCRIVTGDAQQKLNEISRHGPFDAVFIDGNKAAYLDYFNWALENVRAGGLIVADNVFLAGAVWGDQTQQKFNEKQVKAVNSMNEMAFSLKNLQSMIVPTEEGLLVCKKLF